MQRQMEIASSVFFIVDMADMQYGYMDKQGVNILVKTLMEIRKTWKTKKTWQK